VVYVFQAVYLCAIALCFTAGALVTASLFIPDRAPHSWTFLGISLVVTGLFLTLGVVLYGIQRHVACIASEAGRNADQTIGSLAMHTSRLMVYLLLGGVLLCSILGILTYAILARIDQGFAVFG
jgi:hypothetical protein